jgi:hypothetical protein
MGIFTKEAMAERCANAIETASLMHEKENSEARGQSDGIS